MFTWGLRLSEMPVKKSEQVAAQDALDGECVVCISTCYCSCTSPPTLIKGLWDQGLKLQALWGKDCPTCLYSVYHNGIGSANSI